MFPLYNYNQNKGLAGKGIVNDVFQNMFVKGMSPETISAYAAREDEFVIQDKPHYLKLLEETKGGSLDETEIGAFNTNYDTALKYHQFLNQNKHNLPTAANLKKMHTINPNPAAMIVNPPEMVVKDVANNVWQLGTEDPEKKIKSLLTDEEAATGSNYYVRNIHGEDYRVNAPLSKFARENGNYYVDYDDQGNQYWREVKAGEEMYGKKMANIWGDQSVYGRKFLDGVFGFISGATVETARGAVQVARALHDLTDSDNEQEDIDGVLRGTDAYMEKAVQDISKYAYKPSQEVEEGGWFGGGLSSFWYQFGRGLGMLAPQFLSAGVGSAAGMGAKGIMALSSGIGTLQAAGDVYQGAREAGLSQSAAAKFTLLALPAVYTTERFISAPWIAKSFNPTPGMEMKSAFKNAVLKAGGPALANAGDAANVTAAAKGWKSFLTGNKTLLQKVKSGQLAMDLKQSRLGGIASGMVREGSQEATEEFWYVLQEMGHDMMFAQDRQVGEGKFGTKLDAEVGKRLFDSFAGGAILGGFVGAFNRPYQRPEGDQVIDKTFFEHGYAQGMLQNINRGREMASAGIFGSPALRADTGTSIPQEFITRDKKAFYNEDGSLKEGAPEPFIEITEEVGELLAMAGVNEFKVGDVLTSQADVNFFNYVNQVVQQGELIKMSGLENNNMLRKLRNTADKEYGEQQLFQALDLQRQMAASQKKIDDDTARLDSYVAGEEKTAAEAAIEEEKKRLGELKKKFAYRVTPEEGSMYSAAINDFVKQRIDKVLAGKEAVAEWEKTASKADRNNLKKRGQVYSDAYTKAFQRPYSHAMIGKLVDHVRTKLQEVATKGTTARTTIQGVGQKAWEITESLQLTDEARSQMKEDPDASIKKLNEAIGAFSSLSMNELDRGTLLPQFRDAALKYGQEIERQFTQEPVLDLLLKSKRDPDADFAPQLRTLAPKTAVAVDEKKSALRETFNQAKAAKGETTKVAQPEEVDARRTDIQKRQQEELSKYSGRRANSLVKYNPDGENTELTEEDINEAELLINAAKQKGYDVERTFSLLRSRGFVYSSDNTVEALKKFLEARLSGEIDYKVNGEFLDKINAKYEAELAQLGQKEETGAKNKEPWEMTQEQYTNQENAKETKRQESLNASLSKTPEELTGEIQQHIAFLTNTITKRKEKGVDTAIYEQQLLQTQQLLKVQEDGQFSTSNELFDYLFKNRDVHKGAFEIINDALLFTGSGLRFQQDPIRQHAKAVQQALADGKPVPAGVLNDYPELKSQVNDTTETEEQLQQRLDQLDEEMFNLESVAYNMYSGKDASPDFVREVKGIDNIIKGLTDLEKSIGSVAEKVTGLKPELEESIALAKMFGLEPDLSLTEDQQKKFVDDKINELVAGIRGGSENSAKALQLAIEGIAAQFTKAASLKKESPEAYRMQLLYHNEQSIKESLHLLEALQEAARMAHDALRHINDHPDPEVRGHLNSQDVILPTSVYHGQTGKDNGLKHKLQRDVNTMKGVLEDYRGMVGSQNSQRVIIQMRHNELHRKAFEIIFNQLGIQHDDQIRKVLQDIQPMSEEELMRESMNEDDALRSRFVKTAKAIFTIKSWIHANKATFFDEATILKLNEPFKGISIDGGNYQLSQDFKTFSFLEVSSEAILAPENNVFMNVYLDNIIEESLAIDPLEMEKAVKGLFMTFYGKKTDETKQPTFEQLIAIRQGAAFVANGKMTWLPTKNRVQVTKGKFQGDAQKSIDAFRVNNMSVRGVADGGKSVLVAKMALVLGQKLSGKDLKIAVVTPSSRLRDTWFGDGKKPGTLTGLTNITPTPISSQEGALEKSYAEYDFVVWDESSMLTRAQVDLLHKKIRPETGIIYIGDFSQMTPIKQAGNNIASEESGLKLTPVTMSFSTTLSMIRQVADAYKKVVFSDSTKVSLPPVYWEQREEGKFGVRYYGGEREIITDFIASKNPGKALVFLRKEDLEIALKDYPVLAENKDQIFILEPNVDQKVLVKGGGGEFVVESIQGLRRPEVYLAFSDEAIAADANIPSSSGIYSRIFYTGINRTGGDSQFTGIVTKKGVNATRKDDVVWSEWAPPAVMKIDQLPSFKTIMTYLDSVIPKTGVAPGVNPQQEHDAPPKGKHLYANIYEGEIYKIANKDKDFGGKFIRAVSFNAGKNPKGPKGYIVGEILEDETNPDSVFATDASVPLGNIIAPTRIANKSAEAAKVSVAPVKSPEATGDNPQAEQGYTLNDKSSAGFVRVGEAVVVDGIPAIVDAVGALEDGSPMILLDDNRIADPMSDNVGPAPEVAEPDTTQTHVKVNNETMANLYSIGNMFWGTTYTVFSPDVSKLDPKTTRLTRIIKKHMGSLLTEMPITVEFHKNSQYVDDITNETKQADQVLMKFSDPVAVKNFLRLLIQEQNVPDSVIEAAKEILKNYTEDHPINYISSLTQGDKIKYDKAAADLKALMEKASGLVDEKGVYVFPQKARVYSVKPGALLHDSTFRPAKKVVEDLKSQGYVFGSWEQRPKFGKIKAVLPFSIGGISGALIGSMPRMSTITHALNEDNQPTPLTALIGNDINQMKAIKKTNSKYDLINLNKFYRTSWIVDVLRFNDIGGKPHTDSVKKLMASYGITFSGRSPQFGERTSDLDSERKAFLAFAEDLQKDWNGNKFAPFRNLFLPSKLDIDTKIILRSNAEMIQVNYTDIHSPSAYFDLTDLVNDTKVEKPKTSKAMVRGGIGIVTNLDATIDPDKLPFAEKAVPLDRLSWLNRQQFLGAIDDMLGTGLEISEGLLDENSSMRVYGAMMWKNITLNLHGGMAEARTPRHEASHYVFNFALSDEARQKLVDEISILDNKDYTVKEADEAIARRFGERSGKLGLDPWWTSSGLLQRLYNLIDRFLLKMNLYAPTLDRYFRGMERSLFRNYDFKYRNIGSSPLFFADDYTDEQFIESNTVKARIINEALLIDTFGTQEEIENAQGYVEKFIIGYTPFDTEDYGQPYENLNLYTTEKILEYVREEFFYVNNHYNGVGMDGLPVFNLRDVNGNVIESIAIKDATYSDLVRISSMASADVVEPFVKAYQAYHTSRPEILDILLVKALPHYSEGKNKKDSNTDQYDSWDQVDPDIYNMDWMKLLLRNVKFREFDSLSGRLLPWDEHKRVPETELEAYLLKAGHQARLLMQSKFSFANSPVNALIQALNDLAGFESVNGNKKSIIKSFIDQWFQSPSGRSYYQNAMRILTDPDSTIEQRRKANMIIRAVNALITGKINIVETNQSDVKSDRLADGTYYFNHVQREPGSFTDMKRSIEDTMRSILYDSLTLKLKESKANKIFGDERHFDIREDGIYYVNNLKANVKSTGGFKLIGVEKSDFSESYTLDLIDSGNEEAMLRTLREFFGFTNVTADVFYAMAKQKDSAFIKYINEITGFNLSVDRKAGERFLPGAKFLAGSLYNMFYSLKIQKELEENISKATQSLYAIKSTNQEEVTDYDVQEVRNSEIRSIKQSDNYKRLEKYLEKSGELYNMDSIVNLFKETEDHLVDEEALATPLNFFNFHKALAIADSFFREESYNKHITDFTGTTRHAYNVNSHLNRNFSEGNVTFAKQMNEVFMANPDLANDSPFATGTVVDGNISLVYHNWMYDPNSRTKLIGIRDLHSFKSGYRATNDPNTRDWMMMSWEIFIEGLMKSSEHVIVPMGFTGKTTRLIDMVVDKNYETRLIENPGKTPSGSYDYPMLNFELRNRLMDQIFDSLHKRYEVLQRDMDNFIKTSGYSGEFTAYLKAQKPNTRAEKFQAAIKIMSQKGDMVNQFKNDLKKGLVENVHYFISGDGSISLGKALLYNDDHFGYQAYNHWKNTADKSTAFYEIFLNDMEMTAKTMENNGFHFPENTRVLPTSKYGGYFFKYGERKTDADPTVLEDVNPFFEAFYSMYMIANHNVADVTTGSWTQFKDAIEQSKRAEPAATPEHFMVENPFDITEQMYVIVAETELFDNAVTGKKTEIGNGLGIGNAATHLIMMRQMGDEFSFLEKNSAQKPLVNSVDHIIGRRTLIKQAYDPVNQANWNASPFYRKAQKVMLDFTDRMLRERIPSYNDNLYDRLMGFYKNNGRNFQEAVIQLVDYIDAHEHGLMIKKNLVWQIADHTTVKTGAYGINSSLDDVNSISAMSIPVGDVGFILNAHHDVEDYQSNVIKASQVLGLLGIPTNKMRSEEILDLLTQVIDLAYVQFENEIEKIKTPIWLMGADKPTQMEYKVEMYLRKRGVSIASQRGITGNLMRILTNKKMSLDTPGVRELVIYSYRNQLSRDVINTRWDGIRAVQLEGMRIMVFRGENGHPMLLSDIEKRYGKDLPGEMFDWDFHMKAGTLSKVSGSFGNETYEWIAPDRSKFTVSRLQPMQDGTAGEIYAAFPLASKFGIFESESLSDVFTLYLKDGSPISLWGKDPAEIEKLFDKNKKNIDESRTIAFRHSLATKMSISDYYENLRETLLVYNSRVPAHKLISGDINNYIGFNNSSGNFIYLPPEKAGSDDTDYDIDMKTLYVYITDKNGRVIKSGIEGKINASLRKMIETYSDKANSPAIYAASNLPAMKEIAEESRSRQTPFAPFSIGGRVREYSVDRIGDKSISKFAVANKAVGYLMHLGDQIRTVAPGFANILKYNKFIDSEGNIQNFPFENHPILKIADFLQAALDDKKLQILGSFGVTEDSIPVVVAALLDMNDLQKVHDFLGEGIIWRFFNLVNRKNSITYDYSEYQPWAVYKSEYKRISANITGLRNKYKGNASLQALADQYNELLEADKGAQSFLISLGEQGTAVEELASLKKAEKNLALLDQLRDYLITGTALYHISRILSLGNELVVADADHDLFNMRMLQYMGMPAVRDAKDKGLSFKSYATDSKNYSFNELRDMRIDFWKKNSAEYLFDDENRADNLEFETLVQNSLDLAGFIHALPYVHRTVTHQLFSNDMLKPMFLNKSDGFNARMKRYLRDHRMVGWLYPKMRKVAEKDVDSLMFDIFFKSKTFDPKVLDLSTRIHPDAFPYFLENPEAPIKYKPIIINKLDLASRKQRELYKKQFPVYFHYLQQLAEVPDMQAGYLTPHEQEIRKAIRGNVFFENLRLAGDADRQYVQFGRNAKHKEKEVASMSKAFLALPEFLRNQIIINHYLNSGMWYRKGSIADVIGDAFQEEIAVAKDKLYAGFNRGERMLRKPNGVVLDEFFKWLGTNPELNQYMNSEEISEREMSLTELEKKRLTRGVSQRSNEKKGNWYRPVVKQFIQNIATPIYRISDFFDSEAHNTSFVDVIKLLSAEELIQVEQYVRDNKRGELPSFLKEILRGHGYKSGYMILPTGHIMQLHVAKGNHVKVTISYAGEIPPKPGPSAVQEAKFTGSMENIPSLESFDGIGAIATEADAFSIADVQAAIRQAEEMSAEFPGINISSYEEGLGYRLSNYAKIPMTYKGNHFNTSEDAYQHNKRFLPQMKESEFNKVAVELMTDIIYHKFVQHPNLVIEITNLGGKTFLKNSKHELIKNGQIIKTDKWTGENGMFMRSLRDAYARITQGQDAIVPPVAANKMKVTPELNEEIVQNAEGMNAFLKQLSSNFNVSFIPDKARVNKDGSVDRAWVAEDGVHYDPSMMTLSMPMHELAHVWIEILEKYDSPALANLIGMIDREDDLYRIVTSNYPELYGMALDKEYLATLAGFTSVDIVREYLSGRGYHEESFIEKAWNAVKSIWKAITSAISNFFYGEMASIDHEHASLKDVMEAFARDVIAGREFATAENTQDILRSVFKMKNANQRTLKPEINDVKDFMAYLTNGTTSEVAGTDATIESQIDSVVNAMKPSTDPRHKNSRVFNSFGVNYFFRNSVYENKDLIREEVRQKIVNPMIKMDKDLVGKITTLVQQSVSDKWDLLEKARELFTANGEQYLSDDTLSELIYLTGIETNVHSVMRYSDLKNSPIDELKKLYVDGFEGYDPVLIVHSLEEGRAHISLLDLTTFKLDGRGHHVKGKNLFGVDLLSTDVQGMNVTMQNTFKDVRAFILGMQMMAMKSKGDIVMKNIGVLRPVPSKTQSRMIPDVTEVLSNIAAINRPELAVLKNQIRNKNILGVLENESLYIASYYHSAIDQLRNFYALDKEYYSGDNGISLLGDMTTIEIKEAVSKRLRYLSNLNKVDTPEFRMLALAAMENELGYTSVMNSLDDMSWASHRIINPHNVESDVFQYVYDIYIVSKQQAVERVRNYQKDVEDLFGKVIRHYEQTNQLSRAEKRFHDYGSKFFERMYKTAEAETESGIEQARLPELHWTKDDPQTARLYAEGRISDVELELANKVLDLFRERWIQNELHKEKINGGSRSEEDIAKTFDGYHTRGAVPVLEKSVNELIFSKAAKEGIDKYMKIMGNTEALFEDNIDEIVGNRLSSYFDNHKDDVARLEAAGLEKVNDRYILRDPVKNRRMSTNLQNTGNYFMMESVRKEVYERDLLPHVNAANAIYNIYEILGKKQTFNKKYLDDFIKRAVYQRNNDDIYDMKFKLPGTDFEVSTARAVRTVLHQATFFTLAFKPIIWGKSFLFNEINATVNSVAAGIASLSNNEEYIPFFGSKEYLEAHALVFGQGFKKARELAFMYQLIDRTERDILESPFINEADTNIFQEKFAHIGNYATDAYARILAMVSQMIKDGSWDAHIYNPETGNVSYDWRRDGRFAKDGVELTDQGQHSVRKTILGNLVSQGVQKNDEEMTRGYDYYLANNFKWLADKFIIGSMDAGAKTMMGMHYMGAALVQFRLFSIDKLTNAGLFGKARKVRSGAQYKAVKDENGEWISEKELLEIEGTWQSIGASLKSLRDLKNKSLSEIWNEMTPMRRMNLARAATNVFTLCLLFFLMVGFDDEDEKRRRENMAQTYKRLKKDSLVGFLISDILIALQVGEFIKSPLPAISQISRLADIVFGDKKFSAAGNFFPFSLVKQGKIITGALSPSVREQREERQKEKKKQERKEKELKQQMDL